MTETIKIELIEEDDETKKDIVDWPINYKKLIKDIISIFDLSENDEFILKIENSDSDEFSIESQKDLDKYSKNIKSFKVYLTTKKANNNNNIIDIDDLEKLIDSKLGKNNNKYIEEEFEDENEEKFEKDKYEKKLNEEKDKLLSDFKNNLEKDLNEIIEQKSKIMETNINKSLLGHINNISEYEQKNFANLSNELNDINNKINDIRLASDELKDIIPGHGPVPEPIKNQGEDIIFIKDKIELELDKKKAGYIPIEKIKIKNISKKSFKSLTFFLDKEKSFKDFHFFGNLEDEYQCQDLSIVGAILPPGEIQEFDSVLSIKNPEPGKCYKMYIYVVDDKKNKLSKNFEIIVKIKKPKDEEDPKKIMEKKINQIYEELINEINNLENIVNINNLKDKIREKNCDKNAVKSWILEKINEKEKREKEEKKEKERLEKEKKEKEEKLKKEKERLEMEEKAKQKEILEKKINAENIYNELIKSIETEITKNEIIEKIINENKNLEEIKEWVKEQNKIKEQEKAELIYEEISKEINLDDKDKNEVLNKIIELKFDKEQIKEFYNNNDDELAEKMFEELDEEFVISNFIDKEEAIEKIKEYNYDRDKIVKWIEFKLNNI